MSKIIITATIDANTNKTIANTINEQFGGNIVSTESSNCTTVVTNKLFTSTMAETADDNVTETITIDSESMVKIINIAGSIYRTVKPMVAMLKEVFKSSYSQLKDVVGETEMTVNDEHVETQHVVRRSVTTEDGTKISIRTKGSKKEATDKADSILNKLNK